MTAPPKGEPGEQRILTVWTASGKPEAFFASGSAGRIDKDSREVYTIIMTINHPERTTVMKQKLKAALANENGKHIFPFFWQHGEDDETLLRELHSIYDCGIRSVCVESRPHEGFGTESWYEDMALILAECERLGLEFWLLDDKHFPTGRANGLMMKK